MNEITVIGFLGIDPEMKYLPDGTPVTEFSVADNRRRRDPDNEGEYIESVQWFRVHVFGVAAENANRFLEKGRQVAVFGRLEADAYESRDKKSIHPSLDVYAHNVQYLGSGNGDGEGDGKEEQPKQTRRSSRR